MKNYWIAAFGFLCVVTGTPAPVGGGELGPPALLRLRDTSGESIDLGMESAGSARLTVFCFLGTECPLAKLYGPRLQRLADKFAGDGVAFVGVNSNVQDSPAEIDRYATEHNVRFAIAKDADQSIAEALGATRTPEVFLVDTSGHTFYQGRIDDQYEPGISRPTPTRNDLRDAIEAVLAGRPVPNPQTEGAGCLISRLRKTQSGSSSGSPSEPKIASNSKTPSDSVVTFTRDIAPLLNRHCVECHRDGEIGPFALTDYDEVLGWGPMMLEVIEQKRMPPWHADPEIGHFLGERTMPAQVQEKIAAWIDQGMPEGDASDLPEPPQWNEGWHLPTQPDEQIVMRDRAFRVPAEGVVDYQYFVVDPGWENDRWIRAAQVIPGDSRVVHHAIVFVRPPDGGDFGGIGWLGGYVPGQRTLALPPDHGRRIPAGSKLVFQMHYTPNGRVADDTTRVGVWFADADTIKHEVVTEVAINHDFEIPPDDGNYQVHMSIDSFPPQARLLGATPHMHLRGKSFMMSAIESPRQTQDRSQAVPDEQPKPLLSVPAYDFNWQHWYAFADPISLDKVDSLEMTVTFDNSKKNPFNPAPDEYVSWGDQTWEEMAIAFFDIASPLVDPADGSAKSSRRATRRRSQRVILPSDEQLAAREKAIDQEVIAFLSRLDIDGDGQVSRDEAPVTLRRNGFNTLDHNRDGVISRDEIRASAEQRR